MSESTLPLTGRGNSPWEKPQSLIPGVALLLFYLGSFRLASLHFELVLTLLPVHNSLGEQNRTRRADLSGISVLLSCVQLAFLQSINPSINPSVKRTRTKPER